MHTLTSAEFLGTPVSILDHAGRRWLTARDVGRCLGYEDPSRKVIHLYQRHADEFGPDDTFVLNLGTNPQGGNPNTRIFSRSGCVLLAMFANTPRAKDFRAWAKRVLAADSGLPALVYDAGRRVKVNRTIERQAMELYVAGLESGSIARHLGISHGALSLLLRGQYRFSPSAGPDETTPELIAAVAKERARRERDRIVEEFVASAANVRLQQALETVGRQMLAALQSVPMEG
jgi:hypothetical protein